MKSLNREFSSKRVMKVKKQSGMTLIELVIVIIVLAIISAIAAPKFVDIRTEAVSAANAGTKGGVDSAFTMAVARKKSVPTASEFMDEIVGMTCDTTNYDNCDTGNNDGVAGVDVSAQFFKAVDCATPFTAADAAVLVVSYGFSINGAAIAATDCRNI